MSDLKKLENVGSEPKGKSFFQSSKYTHDHYHTVNGLTEAKTRRPSINRQLSSSESNLKGLGLLESLNSSLAGSSTSVGNIMINRSHPAPNPPFNTPVGEANVDSQAMADFTPGKTGKPGATSYQTANPLLARLNRIFFGTEKWVVGKWDLNLVSPTST